MRLIEQQQGFRDWLLHETGALAAAPAARAGLAVYLNNYRGQLMACLAESYPWLRAWLGERAFDAAAARYVDAAPPRHWTLDAYAPGFADAVARHWPDDPEVGELARLEAVLAEVFVAADSPAVDLAGLAAVDWEEARLRFTTTLRRLPAHTNANVIASALALGDAPPAAERRVAPAVLAVWRQGFTPRHRLLDRAEADAVQALLDGQGFGALCAERAAAEGEVDGPAEAGRWLGRWLGDGMIEAVTP